MNSTPPRSRLRATSQPLRHTSARSFPHPTIPVSYPLPKCLTCGDARVKKFSAKAFLQKYGKVILTIMSILLMFVFALPTFRNRSAEESQQAAIGHLNGKKV